MLLAHGREAHPPSMAPLSTGVVSRAAHNTPLPAQVRRRLVEHCRLASLPNHAAEVGTSRACASKWVTATDSARSGS